MFLGPFKSKHDVVPGHLLCHKTDLKAVTAHASKRTEVSECGFSFSAVLI